MNGSVCLKWHDASLSFLLNLLMIISLASLQAALHPCWKRRDNSFWALFFSFIGNKCEQPKWVAKICAHLLPLLDTAVTNNSSLYTLCSSLLYHNWWLIILNCLYKDGCNPVQIPCIVVWQIMSNALLGEVAHFLARTKLSSPDTFSLLTCATCNDNVMAKISNKVA